MHENDNQSEVNKIKLRVRKQTKTKRCVETSINDKKKYLSEWINECITDSLVMYKKAKCPGLDPNSYALAFRGCLLRWRAVTRVFGVNAAVSLLAGASGTDMDTLVVSVMGIF